MTIPPTEGEGYALDPLPPQPPPAGLRAEEVAGDAVVCRRCGYGLRGLSATGRCPECGAPIERSLHGDLLRYSDESYLATLHRGVFLIQAAIAAYVVLTVVSIGVFIGLNSANLAVAGDVVTIVAEYLLIGVSIVMWCGWWLFSAPDPAQIARDKGMIARRVVRVAVVVRAAVAAAGAALATPSSTPGPGSILATADMLVTPIEMVTMAVMFFASMLYVRALAPRLPNDNAAQRARTLMWLGPLLWIFGCGIGAIVALVLYWNLLNWIRIDILRITCEQLAATERSGP